MSSSAWKIDTACIEVPTLSKIMTEETKDRKMQKETRLVERKADQYTSVSTSISNKSGDPTRNYVNSECDSDAVIAKLLQYQIDKEYDDEITRLEKHSSNAKVSISYANYRNTPKYTVNNIESEDEDVEIADKKYWTYFETNDHQVASLVKRGDAMKDGEMNTILDNINNGRRNATFINIPPKAPIKVPRFCLKLPNSVVNDYVKQVGQSHLPHDIKGIRGMQAIAETCLDEPTRLILLDLIACGIIDLIDDVISIKNEYVILHGVKYTPEVPNEYAIKVFKSTSKEFKVFNRFVELRYGFYIEEPAWNAGQCKWAAREMNNLMTMKKFGINCPDVICVREHVLIMSFVGHDNKPAPKLKNVLLVNNQWQRIYKEVQTAMEKLYEGPKLIHNNLSEHSIVWWENRCWFTNVAHMVTRDHSKGLKFLLKGCKNIYKTFQQLEVEDLMSPEDMFKSITGLRAIDPKMIEIIRDDNRKIKSNKQDFSNKKEEMIIHSTLNENATIVAKVEEIINTVEPT